MLRYKVCLPKDLDIEHIVQECPPSFKYDLDSFKYLSHLINVLPTLINDDEPTACISSTYMKNKVANYREYLDYLLENNVIYTDNHFRVGSEWGNPKCKGYGFYSNYTTGVKFEDITKYTLVKNISKDNSDKNKLRLKYNYLTRSFNDNLNIDYEAALKTIDEKYESEEDSQEFKNGKWSKHEKANRRKNRKLKVERMNAHDFYYGVDDNIGRFHSTLTGLDCSLRKFVTYDNKELVSIDLSNSQPLLSTILLRKEFWSDSKAGYTVSELAKRGNETSVLVKRLMKEIIRDSYTMFREYDLSVGGQGVQEFIRLVNDGEVYEDFEQGVYEELGTKFEDRKSLKQMFLKCLYSSNSYTDRYKKVFKSRYRDVNNIFEGVKQIDKTLLPRMLQSIESDVFLKRIAGRIYIEKPELILYTIHDSIVTLSGNEEYVKDVAMDVFYNELGLSPNFKIEYWNKGV